MEDHKHVGPIHRWDFGTILLFVEVAHIGYRDASKWQRESWVNHQNFSPNASRVFINLLNLIGFLAVKKSYKSFFFFFFFVIILIRLIKIVQIEILVTKKEKRIYSMKQRWHELTGLVGRHSIEMTNKVAKWIKPMSRNDCIIRIIHIVWRIHVNGRKSTYKIPHAGNTISIDGICTCSGFISFRDPYMAGNLRTGSQLWKYTIIYLCCGIMLWNYAIMTTLEVGQRFFWI